LPISKTVFSTNFASVKLSVSASNVRIGFVTGTLQLGGSTTFLLNLAGELIRRGVSCRVYSGDNLHYFASDFDSQQIPVVLHDHERCIFEDRIEAVLDGLREYRPNVVIATLAPFSYEILRYVPAGVRRLAMIQADDPNVYATVQKYVPFLDEIVGVSNRIAEHVRAGAGFRGVAVHCIPYGVPVPMTVQPRKQSSAPLRILYLGRINNEQKRVLLLPKIFTELQDAGISFEWTIAGDGPDRGTIASLMRSDADYQKVSFVGAIPYEDVPRILDSHDIFILVSDYEGLPLSLLEAMAHGLVPVVSNLESGIADVVDQSNGMLVPVNDVKGYARAITYLDKNRAEMVMKSTFARDRVRNQFSVVAMTRRWMSILATAAESSVWPRSFQIKGPIGDRRRWKYSSAIRPLRRLVKGF
jgi:glycosyltransferase involved in cell wall biosynthesis